MGQSQIIHTLLPTAADANSISAGQLLCGGLFSADPLSNWFASVALLHAIVANQAQKEQLLRVQLATNLGNPPVSLLQQCCNMLSQGGKFQTRIGLLMVLCGWMCDCPIAVSHFLSNTSNVPYLISQVSSSEHEEHEVIVQGLCAFLLGICMLYNDDTSEAFSTSALKQVIQNRIGLESFTDKLTQVAQNENYTRAAKKAHSHHHHASEIVFDHEFTRLFKSLENEVLKAVSGTGGVMNGHKMPSADEDKYKAMLKEQEDQLATLRHHCEEMQAYSKSQEGQIAELNNTVQTLRDQNALLKAHKGSQGTPPPSAPGLSSDEVEGLRRELDSLRMQVQDKDARLSAMAIQGDENKENNPDSTSVLNNSLACLQGEVAEKDQEIVALKSQLSMLSNQADSNTGTQASPELLARLSASEAQVTALTEEKSQLQDRLTKSNEENLKLAQNIRILEEEKQNVGGEKENLNEEMETLKKEQDDLLVLLADQDAKIDKYKTKLKELGQEVEDDDDDLDDDDDDLDDDEEDAD